MSDPEIRCIADLLRHDKRFKIEAYAFVEESLDYAHRVLKMNTYEGPPGEGQEEASKHLTGRQLCEAIRQHAVEQFGFMAKCVLNSWGVTRTGDFGEIVYNLIRISRMSKTDQDQREDFENVYDFDEAFCNSYRIG